MLQTGEGSVASSQRASEGWGGGEKRQSSVTSSSNRRQARKNSNIVSEARAIRSNTAVKFSLSLSSSQPSQCPSVLNKVMQKQKQC